METELYQVNHLHDYEVHYELAIRKTKTTRVLNDQRKILRRLLAKEKNQPGGLIDLCAYEFDFQKEQREIEKTFYEVTEAIMDFSESGDESDTLFSRIKSRIVHVTSRVNNLYKFLHIPDIIEDEDTVQVQNYFQEAYATCLKLEADLYDNIKRPNPNNVGHNENNTVPIINVAAPVVTCSGNTVPISEWGLKFNGDSKNLFPFLERVTELAQARKISDLDLFNSSVELFVGDAFAWYRCNKLKVNNWGDLVDLLKKDFLHSDVEDQTWDQIKHRKQKKNESVAIFIAHMETLFNRLSKKPAEVTKVKIVRQNLLPDFISQLALIDLDTMSDLLNNCRKLEEANYLKNKNKPHEVTELTQPSNSFGQNNKVDSYKKSGNNEVNSTNQNKHKINYKKFSNPNLGTQCKNNSETNTKKLITCWNCGLANHTFHDCKAKRKIFCFKCGQPDVRVKDCKNCSKN